MAALVAAALIFVQSSGSEVPLPPQDYLYAAYPELARKLDCMIRRESTWNPNATAVRGRYVGLAQFDYPTWLETPQGQSGLSRWDPYASIDAMAWGVRHLGYGRWPVTSRLC
jgi:soluble lytic murein transglycosylase-like protein